MSTTYRGSPFSFLKRNTYFIYLFTFPWNSSVFLLHHDMKGDCDKIQNYMIYMGRLAIVAQAYLFGIGHSNLLMAYTA
jgi:hypothetical protein